MKIKLLIWIVVFICIASGVNATAASLAHYYNMEEGSGTKMTDFIIGGSANGSMENVTYETGKIGNYSIEFNGLAFSEIVNDVGIGVVANPTFSISLWINMNNQGENGRVFIDPNSIKHHITVSSSEQISSAYRHDVDWYANGPSASTAVGIGTWKHVVWVHNTTDTLYIDGVQKSVSVSNITPNDDIGIIVGSGNNGAATFNQVDGGIDDFAIFTGELSDQQVINIYCEGVGQAADKFASTCFGPPAADTINLSETNPQNDSTFTAAPISNKVIVNMSVNVTASINFSIALYINGSLNDTKQYDLGTDVKVAFDTTTFIPGAYNFQFNGSTNETSEWSENNTFYVNNPPDTINLSTTTPQNNSQFGATPVFFNMSVNAEYNFSVGLYINGTLNHTIQYNSGTDVNVSFNTTFFETGIYRFQFKGLTNESSEWSEVNWFYIDIVNPLITADTWVINKTFYTLGGDITGTFNFTDDFYLHNYTASIDGVVISSVSDLNDTFYDYNLSYDPSGLTSGLHNLSIRLSDGHTANKLGGEYEWWNGIFNDYLQFDFYDKGFARIETIDGSIFDSFKAKKQIDRYTFTYEPSNNNKDKYEFEITSDMPINIIHQPNTKWKEWLIMGDHWLDFYNPTEPKQKVKFKQINDYTVQVEIKDIINKDKMSFESIGDLNVITQNYTFGITNISITYPSSINELETQTISVQIDTNELITDTNASLMWNNTIQNITKTNLSGNTLFSSTFLTPRIDSASATINFNWTYNIFSITNNITGNITNSQTIFQIGIDNCSTFNTTAINITVYDEVNDAILNASIDGYFQVFNNITSQYRDFNLTWDNRPNYGVCIFPVDSVYNITAQLEYSYTGYDPKTYYYINTQINNVSDSLSLFLINDTTQVTFTVTDQDDDEVENVFINVQSYDLGTNSYKTTEIVKTDFNGQAFAEMVLFTKWYQFDLIFDGEIKLSTSPTKITSTTLNFRIDIEADVLEAFSTINDIACSIGFNNATSNFNLAFTNPTGVPITATLNVYNQTAFTKSLYNYSSLTSASGTILVGVDNQQNLTYIGIGLLTLDGIDYVCGTPASVLFGGDHKIYGTSGLFYSFLLLIVLVMIGIWNPGIAIALSLVAIIFLRMLGMLYLGWGAFVTLIILGGIVLFRISQR